MVDLLRGGKTVYYIAEKRKLADKRTVRKVERHLKDGTLQPYLEWLAREEKTGRPEPGKAVQEEIRRQYGYEGTLTILVGSSTGEGNFPGSGLPVFSSVAPPVPVG